MRRVIHEGCTARSLAHRSFGPPTRRRLTVSRHHHQLARAASLHRRLLVLPRARHRHSSSKAACAPQAAGRPRHRVQGFVKAGGRAGGGGAEQEGVVGRGREEERPRRRRLGRRRERRQVQGAEGVVGAGKFAWADFRLVDVKMSAEEFVEQLRLPPRSPRDWPLFGRLAKSFTHMPSARDLRPLQVAGGWGIGDAAKTACVQAVCVCVCVCVCVYACVRVCVCDWNCEGAGGGVKFRSEASRSAACEMTSHDSREMTSLWLSSLDA
jgi:hypothetical protein